MALESYELGRIADILEKMYQLQKKEYELKYGKAEEDKVMETLGISAKEFEKILTSISFKGDTVFIEDL